MHSSASIITDIHHPYNYDPSDTGYVQLFVCDDSLCTRGSVRAGISISI